MSEVKVNTITPRSGTTLTLGGSGDTVTLAACASQSGFGRTGTVDWCTTAKTSPFTAATGKGYFVNTCGGVVTVTLPGSSTAGDIVSIADYKSTWQTNNVTLCRNSQKINGGTNNAVLSTEGQSITLVYVDGTQGWKNTMDSTSNVTGEPAYVTASGGTESTSGDYKIHKFTSDGNFVVSAAGTPSGSTKVSYMVVAGGGGGGGDYGTGAAGAGGGGGGYREGKCTSDPYTASPLKAPDGLTVSVQTYPISVGAGGPFGNAPPSPDQSGQPGGNSIFSTITSTGGGGGGEGYRNSTANGKPGGSGGGAGSSNLYTSTVGTGNTPPVSPAQGNDGGTMYGTPQYIQQVVAVEQVPQVEMHPQVRLEQVELEQLAQYRLRQQLMLEVVEEEVQVLLRQEDLEEVELVILQVLEQQERLILEAEAVVQDTHLHHQVELEVQVS